MNPYPEGRDHTVWEEGARAERVELIDFILDQRWYPEHWHYAEGIDFRVIGSPELWQKLKELGVDGLLEYLKELGIED